MALLFWTIPRLRVTKWCGRAPCSFVKEPKQKNKAEISAATELRGAVAWEALYKQWRQGQRAGNIAVKGRHKDRTGRPGVACWGVYSWERKALFQIASNISPVNNRDSQSREKLVWEKSRRRRRGSGSPPLRSTALLPPGTVTHDVRLALQRCTALPRLLPRLLPPPSSLEKAKTEAAGNGRTPAGSRGCHSAAAAPQQAERAGSPQCRAAGRRQGAPRWSARPSRAGPGRVGGERGRGEGQPVPFPPKRHRRAVPCPFSGTRATKAGRRREGDSTLLSLYRGKSTKLAARPSESALAPLGGSFSLLGTGGTVRSLGAAAECCRETHARAGTWTQSRLGSSARATSGQRQTELLLS